MLRALCVFVALCLLTGALRAAEPTPSAPQFAAVRAIFERHCVECHQGGEPDGGLSLETLAGLTRGGESGPAVVPGKVAESLLLDMISGKQPEMPKKRPALRPEQIETLRQWIAAGASWPEAVKLTDRRFDGERWWSFAPLELPSVPSFPAEDRDASWIRNPIDAFILAKQHANGLHPGPSADRRTLIRRVIYDLTGLPPTPEEVAAFVADTQPLAYERLVDRLLDSPRYGERWARHWLDVVHYGETHGYDKDKPRNYAWPYRDYVIRAFNEDKPYGRFIEEQIAGDVLYRNTRDGIEALGFIAAGPWDYIGHAEVPETKIDGRIARHLDRDDMVVNTIQTFNSLTIQCAQCHNHKFDPIAQADYYSLQAVFAAVDRTEKKYDVDPHVSAERARLTAERAPLDSADAALNAELLARGGDELKQLNDQLAAAEKKKPAAGPGALQGARFGYHSQLAPRPDVVKWVQIDLGQSADVRRVVVRSCYDDFAQIGAGFGFPVRYKVETADDASFTMGVRVVLDATEKDSPRPGLNPVEATIASGTARFVRVTATRLAERKTDYMFALAEVEAIDSAGKNLAFGKPVTSLDSIEAGARWGRANLVDGEYPGKGQEPVSKPVDVALLRQQRDSLLAKTIKPDEQRARATRATSRKHIDEQLAKLPPQSIAYIGAVHTGTGSFKGTGPDGGKPRTIRILARGNIQKPGDEVRPGALSAIDALPAQFALPSDHAECERRAALARWLTDRRHPLTWRSIVNRVWMYHFGHGIVDTPNDFGRNGARPTHPELLDWLACQLRDHGQSLKSLHRLMVTSAVYRQGARAESGKLKTESQVEGKPSAIEQTRQLSAFSSQLSLPDPENRFLTRFPRRRLEAEAVRDSVLLVAGKLDERMGGPSFQDFVIEKPEHSPHYEYHLHDPNDPRSHRRSIYRFIVRSQQQPFMTTLDCADPSMQVDKRNESLSSLQALALLNNGFMVTMAGHFAARLESECVDLPGRVNRAVQLTLGREPTAAERASLIAYAEQHGLKNLCRVLLNLNEFVFVD
jgi:mono/diheme cytochrome c family protein